MKEPILPQKPRKIILPNRGTIIRRKDTISLLCIGFCIKRIKQDDTISERNNALCEKHTNQS